MGIKVRFRRGWNEGETIYTCDRCGAMVSVPVLEYTDCPAIPPTLADLGWSMEYYRNVPVVFCSPKCSNWQDCQPKEDRQEQGNSSMPDTKAGE